jgi:hypothetical protein
MKRLLYVLSFVALGGGLSGCGTDTPTAPSAAAPTTYTAVLLPANEVPPITGNEASGSGTATIALNLTKDAAGTISAATMDVTVTVTGFPPGTALTASHIHPGVVGVNGGVVISLGLTPGEISFATGSGSFSKQGITLTTDQANSLMANPGNFYLNIHTAANPGGVARGQLTQAQ